MLAKLQIHTKLVFNSCTQTSADIKCLFVWKWSSRQFEIHRQLPRQLFVPCVVRVVAISQILDITAPHPFSPVLFDFSSERLQSDDMALQKSAHVFLFFGFCALLLISVAEGKRKARDLTPYCGGKPLSVLIDVFISVLKYQLLRYVVVVVVVLLNLKFLCACV